MRALQENAPRIYSKNSTLVFKRWSHKGFSAFISMHREVRIGVVSFDISARLGSKTGLSPAIVLNFVSHRIADGNEEDDGFQESSPDQVCWQFLQVFELVFAFLSAGKNCCGRGSSLVFAKGMASVLAILSFPFSIAHFRHIRFCSTHGKKTIPWFFNDISCLRLGDHPCQSFFL